MKTIRDTGEKILMELLKPYQISQLILNNKLAETSELNVPVAYIIASKGNVLLQKDALQKRWIISELDEKEPNIGFGLFIEDDKVKLGRFSLEIFDELYKNGFDLFNNIAFTTDYPISVFKGVADEIGQIIGNDEGYESVFERVLGNTQP